MIETERLLLEKAVLKDGPFFYALLNSPNWIEWIGDRGIRSVKDAETYIQNELINSYATNGWGLYKVVLKRTQKPIGICGFLKRPGLKHVDIGFAILPEYVGNGYAFEAVKASMKYAASTLALKIILGITTEQNLPSIKVLEKAGLRMIDKIKLEKNEKEFFLYSNEKNLSKDHE